MQAISRQQVKEKLDQGQARLVEVLGPSEFNDFHLPGAVNVPIKDDQFEEKIQQAVPNKDDEVIVYCKDKECSASPTAAEKMESLGYKNVFDYEEGKEDWKSAGLPLQ